MKNEKLKEKMWEWIDKHLEVIPKNVVALCFNLYESYDWGCEIVGSERFDIEDDDWGCDEVTDFWTRDDEFVWENEEVNWEGIQEEVSMIVCEYCSCGKYAYKIKRLEGVGVGFVDGDLKIVYRQDIGDL